MDRSLLAPLAAQLDGGAVVTSAELAGLGASRTDLRRLLATGSLERVVRGVYALRSPTPNRPEAEHRRLVLATMRARTGRAPVVLGGPSAAVMYGLPLLARPAPVVCAAGRTPGGTKPGRGLRTIAPPGPEGTSTLGPWKLTTPARTVLDVARLMSTADGVAAADAALRRGLTTRAELEAAVAHLAGHAGVAQARRVVRLADARSESPGESWSAVVIDSLGLPRPERQQPFHDEHGLIGRSDFWWPEHGVIGEFDGRVKYGRENPAGRAPEDVLWEEKRREDRLRRRVDTVARWTTTELRRPADLLRMLGPLLT